MKLTQLEINKMIKIARETAKNAFVPFNKHPFGSSILTSKGNIYGGCNIENSISGLGICSEMTAINHAISHGEYVFKALCLYDKKKQYSYPCGACRQYISQFIQISGKNILIITSSPLGYKLIDFEKLYPFAHFNRTDITSVKNYAK